MPFGCVTILRKHGSLKPILAPPDRSMPDCVQQLSVLNRLIIWLDTSIELEANPRHVELIVTVKGSVLQHLC